MEVGGNGRARAFFRKHGIDTTNRDDIHSKYQSNAARLYREQIRAESSGTKRASTFAKKEPAPVPAPKPEDDFFSLNTQKATPQASLPAQSPARMPAAVTAEREESPTTNETPSRIPMKKAAEKPKVLLSTSPDKSPSPVLATRRTAQPSAGKGNRLGAKKASTSFDFDDDTWDKFEEEQQKEDPSKEVEEVQSEFSSSRFSIEELDKGKNKKDSGRPESPPLHSHHTMGGYSGRSGMTREQYQKQMAESKLARERFGDAKHISSAQFFGEESSAANEQEKRDRISKFQGASSISSAAYFDR